MASVPSLNPAVLEAREKLQQGRQRLRDQHQQGSPGVQVCAGLTELYDEIIQDLYQAALAALAIISAYIETVAHHVPNFTLEINDPTVLAGMFLGGIFPFLVSSMTMTAVGDAAFEMIHEIRRQFKEIPGLMEGTAEPDSNRCIEIATTAALKRMIAPGVLAVSGPVVVGFLLGPEALGGMLGGALLGCVLLALTMANAGGAWDNAKKFVEKGNLGGKGSEVHKAVVVGDTVGDPFKDTSGPSMNILINVMAIVSLVIAPLLG